MLARHLAGFLDEKAGWQPAMEAYDRERDQFSETTYRRTCKFAADLRCMKLLVSASSGGSGL
jgi:hypothetical protein